MRFYNCPDGRMTPKYAREYHVAYDEFRETSIAIARRSTISLQLSDTNRADLADSDDRTADYGSEPGGLDDRYDLDVTVRRRGSSSGSKRSSGATA